jgi:putative transposase
LSFLSFHAILSTSILAALIDMAALEYQRDEHRVHLIVYHLVWTPKRRKPVLVEEIAKECQRLIRKKCEEKGWKVLELAIQPDHVHLFVRVWPSTSASEVIKECKGLTSHELRAKFKTLLKLPSLWTRSYFASTAGNVSSEVIKRYIEAQKGL